MRCSSGSECAARLRGTIRRMRSAAFLAALLVVACTTSAGSEDLVGRTWTLEQLAGLAALPPGVATPTIRFAPDGHFSGSTGCNNGGASYRIESGDRIVIEAMVTTKRACADPAGNELERAYVAAIQNTRRFRVTAERLELLGAGGEVLARFR